VVRLKRGALAKEAKNREQLKAGKLGSTCTAFAQNFKPWAWNIWIAPE